MADDSQTTAPLTDSGTPAAPIAVTVVNADGSPLANPTAPAVGLDETTEGGAYRFANLDGSTTWKDAEGRVIKAPKGRG